MGTVVIGNPFLNEGSVKTTKTVPLNAIILIKSKYINYL